LALYRGEVFLLPPTAASLALVEYARAVLATELQTPAVRSADLVHTLPDWFERMGRVRRALYTDPTVHDLVRNILAAKGFDPERCAFDPPRLRVVLDRGEQVPAAAAVYALHRDTWYAHPPSLLTWWLPLDDLAAHETFVFYPEQFAQPVANSSGDFDYAAWVADGWQRKLGWQARSTGLTASYAQAQAAGDPGPSVGFACERGANLVFSGAHLHRTLAHQAGMTRFALDFRVVHLDDLAAGLGAPDVDNRSRGSSVPDYVHPGRAWQARP